MTSYLDLPTTARVIAADKKLQSTLRLSDLSSEDAGVYTCSSGDLSSTIEVKIQDKITFTDSPQGDPIEKSIVVGTDNEVVCQVRRFSYYMNQIKYAFSHISSLFRRLLLGSILCGQHPMALRPSRSHWIPPSLINHLKVKFKISTFLC